MSILTVDHVTKEFATGNQTLKVLDDISFSIEDGSTASFVGPSGSGKTTLLSLMAGLDQPSQGTITVNNVRFDQLNEDQLAKFRSQQVGFVFQTFQLIPTLTVLENVLVPLEIRGEKGARVPAESILKQVGLGGRLRHYPIQLSGGEQQRVAVARAFVHQPKILFADEPTGNLDAENSHLISNLLFELNKAVGTTLILVTHNMELAKRTDKVFHLREGRLVK